MRSYKQADWVVRVDKNEFYLTENEYRLLKGAANAGKTMVWFDDITISIPHVSYMERTKKPMEFTQPQLPDEASDLHRKIIEAKRKAFANAR